MRSAVDVPFGLSGALMGVMSDDEKVLPVRLLLKVSDAGAMLGVGRSTVYEIIAAGELETVHIGRCRRVPVAALDEYVRRLRDAASTSPRS